MYYKHVYFALFKMKKVILKNTQKEIVLKGVKLTCIAYNVSWMSTRDNGRRKADKANK